MEVVRHYVCYLFENKEYYIENQRNDNTALMEWGEQ